MNMVIVYMPMVSWHIILIFLINDHQVIHYIKKPPNTACTGLRTGWRKRMANLLSPLWYNTGKE